MSDVKVRAALEKRLNAMANGLTTAHENAGFTPAADTPYQRVELLPAEPENTEMSGGQLTRLLGLFQVTLMYPQGDGPGAAAAQAELIRTWFPRNLSLVESGITVTIDRTPYVMPGFTDDDRWSLPVRVPYFANITS